MTVLGVGSPVCGRCGKGLADHVILRDPGARPPAGCVAADFGAIQGVWCLPSPAELLHDVLDETKGVTDELARRDRLRDRFRPGDGEPSVVDELVAERRREAASEGDQS